MQLTCTDLTFSYGGRNILDHISFSLEQGSKSALVGVNGCGKSTLLKVLAGAEPAQGEMIHKKGMRIHLQKQNPDFGNQTIRQLLDEQNAKLENPREEFEISSIMTQLKLDDLTLPASQLSGGQQRRLSLALALADRADLLLLDEPTNHLDLEMCTWLENWLKKSSQTVLMVTHDRYFLERITDDIFELDHGHLYEYKGNYETYLEQKEERARIEQDAARKRENLYRKELEWVRAGVQARGTKSKSRLDRFEELRSQRRKEGEKKLSLAMPAERMGKKTLEWNSLSFGYDKTPLFSGFSGSCKHLDRIGIIGPNGCGKTTFFKILEGKLKPDEGTIEQGSTIKIACLSQMDPVEDLSIRVIDYIEQTASQVQTLDGTVRASAMLERFCFDKDQQYLSLDRLSGGERRRLYLLKTLMEGPNVLLLDEPTNDLDLLTLEILEEYLDDFPGIVMAVSHDRYFLDRVCSDFYVYNNHQFIHTLGGQSEALAAAPKAEKKSSGSSRPKRQYALNSAEKKELASMEQKMDELSGKIEELNAQISAETDYPAMAKLCQQRDEAQQQLDEAEARWLELEEKKEAFQEGIRS